MRDLSSDTVVFKRQLHFEGEDFLKIFVGAAVACKEHWNSHSSCCGGTASVMDLECQVKCQCWEYMCWGTLKSTSQVSPMDLPLPYSSRKKYVVGVSVGVFFAPTSQKRLTESRIDRTRRTPSPFFKSLQRVWFVQILCWFCGFSVRLVRVNPNWVRS